MAPNSTEEHIESDMEKFLFIIRDHLPKDYVDVLPIYIGSIGRVKTVLDYRAYISLEFANKADATVAKTQGLHLWANGVPYRYEYATQNVLVVYMNDMSKKAGVGNGF